MENSQAALLTLGFLLFLKGCETLASERSTNLAVGVGEDVQLKINPPVAVFVSDLMKKEILSLLFTEPITNVNVKPSLAQPIANQTLKLTCEVLGSQIVSSRLWLKDGQPLSTSDRITFSVDSSVVSFNPVLQSDNGEYQCKASNPVSEVTSAVYRLEVNYGPGQASITATDQAVLNSPVTFTCSAQSLPPCNYTWYFNEKETAQGSQYKIASVSNADSGSYTCVAWNSVTGRKSSAIKEFIVTGLGSLSSGEIAGIVSGTLAGVTGVALGVYFSVKLCRNNPHDLKPGPAQSSPGAVTYENFKGPSASATYENTTAIRRAGEAKNLDSTYTGLQFPDQSTYSTLNRLWLKDGQPLSTSDRITLSVDSSVVSFNPVLQSDNGEYQCKASNPVNEVTSAVYRLEANCLGSLSSGEIAGFVIGTLAGVTGVALGVYFSVKLCRNNPHDLKPGPAQSSPGAVTYENFKEPSASATYENTTAIRRAGLQFPDQSTYSTLNRFGVLVFRRDRWNCHRHTCRGHWRCSWGVFQCKAMQVSALRAGAVTYENFKGPSASATYENTTAIRRAGEAKNLDSTYTGLQFPDQSTYSTLNRP
ncbi:carcinoembryonic antigen-related cell adhesion molecule 5-like isoform X1 [Acipenser oxyrinchus oxyrinchus]|uniref:Carcinoembryonic antigen-related cell adhesion molecule 5-like isoform X1 n=1 Tax=Acipenser oxyrinchus oxyrinchus TaxID=40147 RepID=A0AAD8FVS2_ACIOX|nr:carcinoembryonic antigen-related cell adhesion molecule 5-like isoform X1 [Acipenser oxyrinchus oxyrinchus]